MGAKARDNTEYTTLGDKLATTQGSGCGTLDRCFRHFPASGDRHARLPESATRNTNLGGNRSGRIFHLAMGVDRRRGRSPLLAPPIASAATIVVRFHRWKRNRSTPQG